MTRSLVLTSIIALACLLPCLSVVVQIDMHKQPVLIQQDCPDGKCPVPAPVDSSPSPEKCGAAGGGIVAALLLIARVAFASGKAPWLGPIFEWLATRRAAKRPMPPTT